MKLFDDLQSFVIKWLKNYATNRLGYVYDYEKTVEKLDSAVEKLRKEEKDLRDEAEEDEDKYGREVHDDVKGWLARVEKILSDYEEFKKHEDRECLGCFLVFPNLKARFDNGKIAEDIEKKVRELQRKKDGDESRRQEGPSSMGDDAIASSSNANNESSRQSHEAIMKLISTEYITKQLANLCNQEKNAEAEEQDKVDKNLQEEADMIVPDTSQQEEYQYNESRRQGPSSMGDDSSSSSCNSHVEAEEQDKVDENRQEQTEITVPDASSHQDEDQDEGEIDDGEVISDSEHKKALEKHEDRECLGCALVSPYLRKSYHLGKMTKDVEEKMLSKAEDFKKCEDPEWWRHFLTVLNPITRYLQGKMTKDVEEDVTERQMKKEYIESITKLIIEPINQLVHTLNPKKKVAELDKVAENLRREEGQSRREIDDGDKKWLDDVKGILLRVEDFKKREDLEWGWRFLAIPNPITRYHQGKKAEVIKMTVEQLQKETHDNRTRWPRPLSIGDVFSNVYYESYESRKEIMNNIMAAIEEPSARMIGVHGSAGLGKTTLVIEAAKRAREGKLFDVMIMVKVTRSPDIRKLQGQIADMLRMTLEEESEQGRAVRIRKRLKKENQNILIILDDLYAPVDLNMLGIPMENGDDGKLRNLKELGKSRTPVVNNDDNISQKKPISGEKESSFPLPDSKMTEETTPNTGSRKSMAEGRQKVCKILLISEVRQVLVKQMDGKERLIFSVSNLNDNEAETLFKNMAGIDDKKSEYGRVAAEIARKCDGLPMTIVTTARALKNQSYSVWLDKYQKLEGQKVMGTPDDSTKLSYQLLGNEELKITFLLCARMGQDALISDLVKFCIGLGFLQGVYTVREARDRVQTLLVTLKESGLLSDSYSTDRFTMQNLIRSAALSIASEERHAFTLTEGKIDEWPAEDKLERYTAISLRRCHVIEKFPESIMCPRLRAFEVENNGSQLEIPDNFFKEMKELRVLCLTGVNLKSLPSSIKFLTKLRMLCLEQCILSEGLCLSIIEELKNLRILSFSGSNIESLPDQLKYLSKLQVLDISNCSQLKVIPPNVISSLTSLEELYMRNTSIQWSDNERQKNQCKMASISELGNLNQLANLDIQIPNVAHLPKNLFFDKLYSYKIIIGSSNRYLLPGFKMPEKYELSRFLAIQQKDDFDIHSQKGIKMLFDRVEDLMLEKLNGVEDIFYALNITGFPCLKRLSIVSNSSIQTLIKPKERELPEEAFTKLKTLHLYKVKKMKQVCSCGSLSETSFSRLKVIKIKLCHELKSVFSISMVGHLISLETVEVSECNSLKEIVPVQTSNARESLKFPNLRSVILQSLSDFIGFYPPSPAPAEGTKILFHDEKIEVSKLEIMELSSIPINQIWAEKSSHFQHLIHLDVNHCENLKYLLSFSMARSLVKLQRLFVSECDQMEHLFFQGQESNAKEKNCIFPKLKNIKLTRMRSLSEIWNSEFPTDSIDNLDTLIIEECDKLVNVYTCDTLETFQSLGSLTVKNCKSMKAIFDLADGKRYAKCKTKLQDVHLETLPELEQVFKWKKEQESVVNLNHIRKIWLQDCERVENIFPSSVDKTFENFEYLVAWGCSRLREIVAEGVEAKTNSAIQFKFPELTTIKFLELPNFKSFYPGECRLNCPKLKDLSIERCDKLEPFRKETTNDQGRCILFPVEVINKLKSMQIESRYAKSSTGYNYRRDKLEELHLSRLKNIEILYSFLHHNPKLKSLWLNDCSFGVLVPLERPAKIESLGFVPKLKSLNLTNLAWLKEIGFERDTIFQRIESLILKNCPRLDTIAPSAVFFSRLTCLEVVDCDRLKYLVSLRTAESLVQLNTMKVINCNSLNEIVSGQGSEAEKVEGREKEENASKFRIVFRHLKALELVSLKSLESFCRSKICAFEFPSLEKFVVKACSKLENFTEKVESAMVLQKVYAGNEKENRWYWQRNLQDTIQYIFQNEKFFEGMVELSVSDHPELKEVWQRKEVPPKDKFYSLKALKLKDCKFETYAIPCNVLCRLKSLQELEVSECTKITSIFGMNDMKIRETPLVLKKLTLKVLRHVTHVWQQEQEEHKQGILSFKNLQQVHVYNCVKLQTLLPAALARDLKMLEKLEVIDCKGLRQIVRKEDGTDRTVVFPRLTRLMLCTLPNLTSFYSEMFAVECPKLDYLHVGGCNELDTKKIFQGMDELEVCQRKDGPPKVWFYSLKTLKLNGCKFETCAIPSNVLGHLKSLQELEVRSCSSLKFIFGMNDKIREKQLALKKLTLSWLSDVRHVWQQEQEEHKQGILSFKNLQQVFVEYCQELKTLLPAALAGELKMLEKLEVRNCNELPQIVGKEGEAGNGTLVFPRLTSLVLYSLRALTFFYSQSSLPKAHWIAVKCPELDYLDVRSCPKLELFQSQQESDRKDQGCSFISDIKAISKVEKLYLSWKDASLWLGQSKDQDLRYLSELHLSLADYEKENLPLASEIILEKALNLEKMEIRDCISLKEISLEGMLGRLKRLELRELDGLHSIGVLEHLPKLQELRVSACPSLRTLVQPSAAKLLTHLEEIYVRSCDSMNEIVGKGQDEKAVQEIKFERLEMISLGYLSSLECFYSGNATLQLPSLIQVNIKQCPEMKSFSQGLRHVEPPSRLIQVSCGTYGGGTELVLHHDLNAIVGYLPDIEKGRLVPGDDPTLRRIWLGEAQIPFDWLFRNLNFLVVKGCEFLLNAILPSHLLPFLSNLKMLEVQKCDSVKTIFDAKHLQNQRKGRISLPGLQEVIVSGCKSIESLFPASFAKDNLKKLDVRDCAELEEIVAKDDETATEEASKKVAVFPKVTSLTLKDLPKLRCICSGMDILDWPMLQDLDVYHCQMLKIFATDFQNSPNLHPEGQDHFMAHKHGIFSARQVSPNLKRLSLDEENVIMIEQGLVPRVDLPLQNIKFLTLQGFDKAPSVPLPHVFFSKVTLPSIEELNVSFSTCLTNLAPSTVSFSCLTKLNVRDCAGLKYLFTSSTARSMVVLSEMSIINCESLETIVAVADDEEGDYLDDVVFPELSSLSLKKLPKLGSLFPASFANDNLKKLDVRNCAETEEIVAEDDETATEEASKKVAVFPKVTSLTLWDLPKLRCICSGMDIPDWPVLQNLDVYHCQMLKIFATDLKNSPDLYPEGQDHFMTDKYGIISADKVPPNLERLSLNKEDFILIEKGLLPHVFHQLKKIKFLRMQGFNNDSDVLFPKVFFSKVPSIQEFEVADSAFKEIFPSQMAGMDFSTKSFSQLKKLELRSLYRLEFIGFEHTWVAPLVENLLHLKVLACTCLTNLAPSTVFFSGLTGLNVEDCAGMKYLFTSSTAKSLVALKGMSITNCESLETVVVADDEEGDKKDEHVVFPKLSSLSLKKLPKLGSFYTGNSTLKFIFQDRRLIPALFKNSRTRKLGFSVQITQCKSMKTFSRGDVRVSWLKKLEIDIDGAKWDGVDLNSAVRQQFEKARKQP